MAQQTVRYAKNRAAQDPDRGAPLSEHRGAGVYFGTNVPYRVALDMPRLVVDRMKTSRGACVTGK